MRNNILRFAALALLLIPQISCGGRSGGNLEITTERGANAPAHGQPDHGGPAVPDYSGIAPEAALSPELARELMAFLEAEIARLGTARQASAVPSSEASMVSDLELASEGPEGATFTWSFRSQGDYDQNGQTNVSDLTPLGQYFGRRSTDADWLAAEPADGDSNGQLNISDITPIAANFNSTFSGYILQTSPTPEEESSWTLAGSVLLSEGVMPEGGGFRGFTLIVEALAGSSYRVLPYAGDPLVSPELGVASNLVTLDEAVLPPAAPLNLIASQGELADQIRVSWELAERATGYEIYKDGGTEPLATVGEVTEYVDGPIGDLLEHSYHVVATSAEGDSEPSLTVSGFASRRGDWWMLGRNPAHNALSPITGPQDNDLKWVFETGHEIFFCGASIDAEDTMYVGTCPAEGVARLYAIRADGTEKWHYDSADWVQSTPAIAPDGTVYFGTLNELVALNPDNGSERWTYPITGFGFASPAIAPDGTVYCAGGDTLLYAINPNGTLKWGRPTSGSIFSSPTIASNGTVYIGNESGDFYSISPTGDINWTFVADGPVRSSASIAEDGTLYFGTLDGTFYAVNPTGKERWSYPVGSSVFSTPAIGDDGTIYFGTEVKDLLALNTNGTLRWRFDTGLGGWIEATPTIGADGTIYFGTGNFAFYALDPAGDVKWDFSAGGSCSSSSAIASDGTLYAPCGDGRIYAFGEPQPVAPPVPTGLTASNNTLFEAIRLEWNRVYLADEYEIFRDGGASPVATLEGETLVWVDEAVEDTAQHSYTIRAVNEFGASALSAQAIGRANNNPPGPGDWFMFGHDQAHTRVSPFTGPAQEVLDWSINLGLGSYSSAAIGNYGELFVGTESSTVACVNADGTIRWEFNTEGSVGCSPAIAPDGTIYAGDWEGVFYAITPEGTEDWRFEASDIIYSPPNIADDGTIYFGSVDGNLYALNPNGSLKWDYPSGGAVWSSPAIGSDGTIYAGNELNEVFAINPDGSERWSKTVGGKVFASASVKWDAANGDTIYIGSDDGIMNTFDEEGNAGWTVETEGGIMGSVAIADDGSIYFGSLDGLVYAREADGSELWTADMFAPIRSSPAIDDAGIVWIGDTGGFLNALNSSGAFVWFASTIGSVWDSSPSIGADGTVFITDDLGYLYAFGPGN